MPGENKEEAWFFQLERRFTLADVTTDATKFNHALVDLDEASISLVTDVLGEFTYPQLKERLIRHL